MLALWPDVDPAVLDSGGLTVDAADSMVENVVGTLSLPMGLGLNFIINGEPLEARRPSPSNPSPLSPLTASFARSQAIPMAVEEPSVIAATSGAAKVVASGGGFETSTTAKCAPPSPSRSVRSPC